jgi:hypothetical protein
MLLQEKQSKNIEQQYEVPLNQTENVILPMRKEVNINMTTQGECWTREH